MKFKVSWKKGQKLRNTITGVQGEVASTDYYNDESGFVRIATAGYFQISSQPSLEADGWVAL